MCVPYKLTRHKKEPEPSAASHCKSAPVFWTGRVVEETIVVGVVYGVVVVVVCDVVDNAVVVVVDKYDAHEAQQSTEKDGQLFGSFATISAHVHPLEKKAPTLSPYRHDS